MAGIKQVLDAADAAAKSGDLDRAIGLYRQILTKVPKHSKAKKALTRLEKSGRRARMTQGDASYLASLVNTGDFENLEKVALDMSRQFRNEPFVFNILGYAHSMTGRTKEALTAYKWAIKLNPSFIEAYSNYGSLLAKIGRLDDAISILKKGLSKRADYAEAHHNLGVAYFGKRELELADVHYTKAIELDPRYANAMNSRGSLRMSTSDYIGALADFSAAEKLDPRTTLYTSNRMSALVGMGHADEAIKVAEDLIKSAPNDPEFRLRYSIQLNQQGRREEAIASFERLLEMVPGHSVALRVMSRICKGARLESLLDEMKGIINTDGTPAEDIVQLGFGLGLTLEEAGDYEESVRYLKLANETNVSLLPTPPETDEERFAKADRMIDSGVLAKVASGANDSAVPILIVGLMRSGTSLVEQIIASHSDVFGAGEMMSATKLSKDIYKAGSKATPELVHDFAKAYLEELKEVGGEGPRIIDKMPDNFFHVGLIKTAFPNAKIINLVRDPRDACFSIYKNFFDTDAHQYAYDQKALADYANGYKRLMKRWNKEMPGAVIHVRYEDLVANQEEETRKLMEALDLPWQDQVLDFHKTERSVRTASVNQVRNKMYASSVKSWGPYEAHLSDLFDGFDQELWAEAFVD